MSEKRTEYIPKYIDSSISKKDYDTETDEDEILDENPDDVVSSLKEKVEAEIENETKEDAFFYVSEEKKVSEENKDPLPSSESRDFLSKKRKRLTNYHSAQTPSPSTAFSLDNIALFFAFFFSFVGFVLGFIVLFTGKTSSQRKKGVIAILISLIMFFLFLLPIIT